MNNMEEIRLRVARADDAGLRAWNEATTLARRVLNTRGEGAADEEAVRMIGERLERVRVALAELADVKELLGRAASRTRRHAVRAFREDVPCVTCQRTDALVNVPICARCSGLGPFTAVR